MGFFDQNLVYLKARDPMVADQVLNNRVKINTTSVQPKKSLANGMADWSGRVDQFFCLGLGTGAKAIVDRYSKAKVVIVEPNLKQLAVVLDQADFRSVFEASNVVLGIGWVPSHASKYFGKLDPFLKKPVQFLVEPDSPEMKPERTQHLAEWRSILLKRRYDYEISFHQEQMINENILENSSRILKGNSLASQTHRLNQAPILIVAPGPSVRKSLEKIDCDAFFVIALDTAISVCVRLGIKPDMIVSVDAFSRNQDHFEAIPSGWESCLFCGDPAVAPQVLTYFQPHRCLFYQSRKPLVQWMEAWTGVLGHVEPGMSVIIPAVQIAAMLTTGPVILAGLDLGYTQHQRYDDAVQTHLATIRSQSKSFDHQEIGAESILGEPMTTTRLFLSVRDWISGWTNRVPNDIINLSKGLPIPGTKREISKLTHPKKPILDIGSPQKVPTHFKQNLDHLVQDFKQLSTYLPKSAICYGSSAKEWDTQIWTHLQGLVTVPVSVQTLKMVMMAKLFFERPYPDPAQFEKWFWTKIKTSAHKLWRRGHQVLKVNQPSI